MKKYCTLALLIFTAALLMAQRPGYGGNSWQVKATLTSTPTALSAMAGTPPPANTTIFVCEGNVSSNAGTAAKITITDGTGSSSWPGVAPMSPTAASHVTMWSASSSLSCEWMPSGALVSSDTAGVLFKASGIY